MSTRYPSLDDQDLVRAGDGSETFRRMGVGTRKSFATMAQGARVLHTELNSVALAATLVGGALSGLGAAFLLPLKKVVEVSKDFEHEMNAVRAVANATDEEFQKLTSTAKAWGALSMRNAQEVAQGMKFLALAGFETQEILSAIPAMIRLSEATGTDMGRAADIVSNIMKGFRLEADQTGQAVNTMTTIISSTNQNLEQLASAMKYVGGVSSAVKISLEQVAAAAGVLSDAGIQGE